MKIAFLWYFNQAKEIYPNWRDGHRTAMELVGKKHDVDWILGTPEKIDDKYEFILLWDNCWSEFDIDSYKGRKGLCLTSDQGLSVENLRRFDVVFCESSPVLNKVKDIGVTRAIKAFGTDTKLFKPKDIKKDIEYFYPATFSPWKRQREIAYLGKDLLCVGTVQSDGLGEYNTCLNSGVKIKRGFFPVEKIVDCYQRTKSQ